MAINREKIAGLVEKLREQRDEIRLKAHLGSMEAKDEWAELEKKWRQLESRLGDAKEDAAETSREIGEGVELVAEELRTAYDRIRERLRER